jgi:hypothetical protein
MPQRLKEVFVRHSASFKYLSCPQSSPTAEKISRYLFFYIIFLYRISVSWPLTVSGT